MIAALLVLVPFGFNLARAGDFKASVVLFPRPIPPFRAVYDPGYYKALLQDPELRGQMQLNVGTGVADYDDVTFTPVRPKGPLRMTVAAPTPTRAQRFVNALAPQMVNATSRQLAVLAERARIATEVRSETAPRPADRRALRKRARRLLKFGDFPPPRVLIGRPAPRPALDHLADRLASDLPGDFHPRPNPLWAALAGLLVALTLWAIGLVLVPPSPRPPDEGLPQPD